VPGFWSLKGDVATVRTSIARSLEPDDVVDFNKCDPLISNRAIFRILRGQRFELPARPRASLLDNAIGIVAISRDLMFPTPKQSLKPNTFAYESGAHGQGYGLREYDARWLFEKEITSWGEALGLGLGTLLHELGVKPEIVTGHDFRSISGSIKLALVTGLMAAGIKVHDIGLAVTPMAYFAQFALDVPAVAMVTASHNENGWTGVKMGANRPLTFGPHEMGRLRDIVLSGKFSARGSRLLPLRREFPRALHRRSDQPAEAEEQDQAVVACGNGTAGAFAPQTLEAIA